MTSFEQWKDWIEEHFGYEFLGFTSSAEGCSDSLVLIDSECCTFSVPVSLLQESPEVARQIISRPAFKRERVYKPRLSGKKYGESVQFCTICQRETKHSLFRGKVYCRRCAKPVAA